jgi:hypothetical protein
MHSTGHSLPHLQQVPHHHLLLPLPLPPLPLLLLWMMVAA